MDAGGREVRAVSNGTPAREGVQRTESCRCALLQGTKPIVYGRPADDAIYTLSAAEQFRQRSRVVLAVLLVLDDLDTIRQPLVRSDAKRGRLTR